MAKFCGAPALSSDQRSRNLVALQLPQATGKHHGQHALPQHQHPQVTSFGEGHKRCNKQFEASPWEPEHPKPRPKTASSRSNPSERSCIFKTETFFFFWAEASWNGALVRTQAQAAKQNINPPGGKSISDTSRLEMPCASAVRALRKPPGQNLVEEKSTYGICFNGHSCGLSLVGGEKTKRSKPLKGGSSHCGEAIPDRLVSPLA